MSRETAIERLVRENREYLARRELREEEQHKEMMRVIAELRKQLCRP